MLQEFWQNIRAHALYRKLEKLTLPGLQGIPVFTVIAQFRNSLSSSRITMRAAAVSFSFFMALFPTVIFLFTLTAYLPIPNFDVLLLEALEDVLPTYTYLAIENTLRDIISIQRGGLLSFGFLLALFYATNGTTSLIQSFNALSFADENRSIWRVQLLSLILTFLLVILLVAAIAAVLVATFLLDYFIDRGWINAEINRGLISVGKWTVVYLVILFSTAMLYYFGPVKAIRPNFFSPGALVVSVLLLLLLPAFGYFVNNFSTWNTVYGSVGALIAVLVLINVAALLILAGHEYNAVVTHLKRQHRENALKQR